MGGERRGQLKRKVVIERLPYTAGNRKLPEATTVFEHQIEQTLKG